MNDIAAKKVLCVGLINCDAYFYDCDPALLSKPAGTNTRVLMAAGGDATNVSIDLARLGFHSTLVGLVGNDYSGDGVLKNAAEAGVDVSHVVRREDVDTTTTLILYTREAKDANDRHCSRNEGGNARLRSADVTDAVLEGAAHLHYGSFGPMKCLDGEDGAKLLRRAREKGLTTSLDVKGLGRDYRKLIPMLPYVDYFIPNIDEVKDLTGLTDLAEMKRHFLDLGVKTVCIKMAEKGVLVADRNEEYILPTLAKQEEIVDIMGAGDAFCAGFIAAKLAGLALADCGRVASLASKHCLASAGASTWQATFAELVREADIRA